MFSIIYLYHMDFWTWRDDETNTGSFVNAQAWAPGVGFPMWLVWNGAESCALFLNFSKLYHPAQVENHYFVFFYLNFKFIGQIGSYSVHGMLSSLVHAMSFSNFVNSVLFPIYTAPKDYHSNVLNEYILFVCAFVKCFVVFCTCMSQLLKQHFLT